METKNAYIIAVSIIVASCIISFSVRGPGDRVAPVPAPATPAEVSHPAATKAPEKRPEQNLLGRWKESATWGSLLISEDGTAVFSSPPESIHCRWSVPEEGKFRTETDHPKKGAPGVFGDPQTIRTWNYTFVGTDQLVLTYKTTGPDAVDERISYMRVVDDRDKR